MKKITLMSIVALVGVVLSLVSYGQTYVSIPDPNFRALLKLTYPSCFNANDELDTTCPLVNNETIMTYKGSDIKNIEGVQYFKNLRYMDFSYNFIAELPQTMPPRLKRLIVQDNLLQQLPSSLHIENLDSIDISYNFICNIPSKLPLYALTNNNFCVDFSYEMDCTKNELRYYAKTPQKAGYNYSWDFDDPKYASNLDNPINNTETRAKFVTKLILYNNIIRTNAGFPMSIIKTIEVAKEVNVSLASQLPMQTDITLCGTSTILNATPGFKSYLWNDGSTSNALEVKKAGTYTVMVTNNMGCSAVQQIVVKMCNSTTPGNNNESNGQTTNTSNSTNTASGTNAQSTDEFDRLLTTLKIPNIVTPNNDGKNDFFRIEKLDQFTQNKLQIYNRWGDLIYETNNYKNNWSGHELDPAVYFYQLTVYAPSFITRTFTGWVEVLGEHSNPITSLHR